MSVNERENFWSLLINSDDFDENIIVKKKLTSGSNNPESSLYNLSRVLISGPSVSLVLLYAKARKPTVLAKTRLIAIQVTRGSDSLWVDCKESWSNLKSLKRDVLMLLAPDQDVVIKEGRLSIGGESFDRKVLPQTKSGDIERAGSGPMVLSIGVSRVKRSARIALVRDLGVSIKQAIVNEFAATGRGEIVSMTIDVKCLSRDRLLTSLKKKIEVGPMVLFLEIQGFGNNASSRALFAECVGIDPEIIVSSAFGEDIGDRLLLVYQHVIDELLPRIGDVEETAVYKLISRSVVLAAALLVAPPHPRTKGRGR